MPGRYLISQLAVCGFIMWVLIVGWSEGPRLPSTMFRGWREKGTTQSMIRSRPSNCELNECLDPVGYTGIQVSQKSVPVLHTPTPTLHQIHQ